MSLSVAKVDVGEVRWREETQAFLGCLYTRKAETTAERKLVNHIRSERTRHRSKGQNISALWSQRRDEWHRNSEMFDREEWHRNSEMFDREE